MISWYRMNHNDTRMQRMKWNGSNLIVWKQTVFQPRLFKIQPESLTAHSGRPLRGGMQKTKHGIETTNHNQNPMQVSVYLYLNKVTRDKTKNMQLNNNHMFLTWIGGSRTLNADYQILTLKSPMIPQTIQPSLNTSLLFILHSGKIPVWATIIWSLTCKCWFQNCISYQPFCMVFWK